MYSGTKVQKKREIASVRSFFFKKKQGIEQSYTRLGKREETIGAVSAIDLNNGATFVEMIVFKKEDMFFGARLGEHSLFILHGGNGVRIVCRHPRDGYRRCDWNNIAGIHQRSVADVENGADLPHGMSVVEAQLHTGAEPLVATHSAKFTGTLHRKHVFGKIGIAFAYVRTLKVLPLCLPHPMHGVGESEGEVAIGIRLGASAAMVEMEMGKHHVGNVGAPVTEPVERRFKIDNLLHAVILGAVGMFIAYTGIYEYQLVGGLHQQATHGQRTEILIVARIPFHPCFFGNDPKHGPPIGHKRAGFYFMKLHRIGRFIFRDTKIQKVSLSSGTAGKATTVIWKSLIFFLYLHPKSVKFNQSFAAGRFSRQLPNSLFFYILDEKYKTNGMYRVHFIAIGGAAMHNLAIALHKKSMYEVTGSDDEFFEPSLSRLKKYGLLPDKVGWFPEKIHSHLDAVILGMHARADNPELARAKELGIKIYSFPEYLYEQTRTKTRIVVGGSHGKTTTTAMILHVMRKIGFKADYMVGALIEGFENMVSLSDDARVAVFEGDEYLTSTLDPRPKFHLYKAHIAILTGIAWDHINVFPTFDNYVEQFRKFIDTMETQGRLIYFAGDEHLKALALHKSRTDIVTFPYRTPKYEIRNGVTYVKTRRGEEVALQIFGEHNLQNMEAARLACKQVGIMDDKFYAAMADFPGASNRLQKIVEKPDRIAFKDFAHSPSKLKATVCAVRNQYPNRKIVACMELHTFSSLSENFLPQYAGSMADADVAYVYYNPEVIKHKKLATIQPDVVQKAFGGDNLTVLTDSAELQCRLRAMDFENTVLLLMTSGNFSGVDLTRFAEELLA